MRDAIGVMRMICERCLEFGNSVYICFVDFEKAFDRENWDKMIKVLQSIGVNWRDRRMISKLYMNQEAVVRIAGGESDAGIIGRGVRQGCSLSPLVFSIYAEMMMKEALENVEEGIGVGGELIKDVKYAFDQGMVANTEAGLQSLMDSLNTTAKHYDMKINIKKTKAMVVSRNGGERVNITVESQSVEQVSKFRYLGSLISEDGRCLDNVKTRFGMAKDAFNKRKELLTRSFRVDLRKSLVKTLVWPVVLYGCETWTMRKEEINRLNAFEMWVWRRMGKISWMDKRTNEQVVSSMNEKRSLIKTIWDRKKNWIGHVVKGDGRMKLVLEERMEGKSQRGRQGVGMIDDVLDETYGGIKRKAENRENWRFWKPRTRELMMMVMMKIG